MSDIFILAAAASFAITIDDGGGVRRSGPAQSQCANTMALSENSESPNVA